ncbi:retrovirus-related pol polyprotein from transposon TNT 1-94 [Tanacetum coccineum]
MTSTTCTPQQNGVVERRNCTLEEAARTMLIFFKSPLFLWAKAVATAYLGKLQPKADIGIFIGYSPSKKAFRIYNKRTRQIMERMNVQFDELTQMDFKQHGSGPDLHGLTYRHISSGLVLNKAASTSAKTPTKNDWDLLFQPMFNEYFKNSSVGSNPISAKTLPPPDIAEASSSSSTSPNIEATNSPLNSTNVETNEEVAMFDSDTFTNIFYPLDTSSAVTPR